MFLHTSCSYSRYVTSSTPALASFRRLSKAAINAAGVSRCAIERKRVVLSAVASSDNRRSSVDIVLRRLSVVHVSPNQDVLMFAPSLQWVLARPVPHLPWYYGVVRLFFARPGGLWSPSTTRYPRCWRQETKRSPRFVGNPSESVPRARNSGGFARPSHSGSHDAAFRGPYDVGPRDMGRFRS